MPTLPTGRQAAGRRESQFLYNKYEIPASAGMTEKP